MGMGMGLSKVYGLVCEFGGQVYVTSAVGLGTSVCTYSPRCAGASIAPEAAASTDVVSHGQGEMVLLVEDEAVLRELIVEVLIEAGFRCTPQAAGQPPCNGSMPTCRWTCSSRMSAAWRIDRTPCCRRRARARGLVTRM
jgi:hypothetical protein